MGSFDLMVKALADVVEDAALLHYAYVCAKFSGHNGCELSGFNAML